MRWPKMALIQSMIGTVVRKFSVSDTSEASSERLAIR